MGIQYYPPSLVYPEILFDQATILLRQETVGEAYQSVRRGHGRKQLLLENIWSTYIYGKTFDK